MPHDAFVSHSTKDKLAADAVVAHLEHAGIRCWISPRDIVPGSRWGESIINAIISSKVIVVVFSSNANLSDHVPRELERAVSHAIPIVPVRIEDVLPKGDLEYFLSASHWMDAISPPLEKHLAILADTIHRLLQTPSPTSPAAAPPTPSPPTRRSARRLIAGACALCLLAALLILLLKKSSPAPESPSRTAIAQSNPATAPADDPMQQDIAAYNQQSLRGATLAFFESRGPLRYGAWLAKAQQGDAMAQLFVGRCLFEGAGVPANQTQAAIWIQKSADQGNPAALLNLGYFYDLGLANFPQDSEMALTLFRSAADRGNTIAMTNLAILYRDGGVHLPQNIPEAARLFTRAAQSGDLLAMRSLAALYDDGAPDFPKDPAKAHQLYTQAADAGDGRSQGILLAPPIIAAFQAYAAPTATPAARAQALLAAQKAMQPLASASLEALLYVLDDIDIRAAIEQPLLKDLNDPLRRLHTTAVLHAIDLFRHSPRPTRNFLLPDFAEVTAGTVIDWHKSGDVRRVAAFWNDCFSDVSFVSDTSGERTQTLRELTACILSLFATGNRPEAQRQLNDALAMSDAILHDRPWDWYLKDATAGLCFSVAEVLRNLADSPQSQKLLQRAWTITLNEYGREDLLTKFPLLPLKGEIPDAAQGPDRDFFESFSTTSHIESLLLLTISADFGGVTYPVPIHILPGKRAYAELQDQFRWLREYRGGVITPSFEASCESLNQIAKEKNLDFIDMVRLAMKDSTPAATQPIPTPSPPIPQTHPNSLP